jgi:hypothetical protein
MESPGCECWLRNVYAYIRPAPIAELRLPAEREVITGDKETSAHEK